MDIYNGTTERTPLAKSAKRCCKYHRAEIGIGSRLMTASLLNESQCGPAQWELVQTPIVLPRKQRDADVLRLLM